MEKTIRLVAVDMDGTFLNQQHDFDRPRFAELLARMEARGCRFVAASGNQYWNLRASFGDLADRVAYVAENGALIVGENGEVLFHSAFSREKTDALLNIIRELPFMTIVSGLNSAYLQEGCDPFFLKIMRHYFPRLQELHSWDDLHDEVLKFSVSVPEAETMEHALRLREQTKGLCDVTSSGHGCVDLIVPDMHKAAALRFLMQHWDIPVEETMAFGDGGNDTEMLELVRYGYVMENGSRELLNRFPLHAPSNQESGVLQVLEQYFES